MEQCQPRGTHGQAVLLLQSHQSLCSCREGKFHISPAFPSLNPRTTHPPSTQSPFPPPQEAEGCRSKVLLTSLSLQQHHSSGRTAEFVLTWVWLTKRLFVKTWSPAMSHSEPRVAVCKIIPSWNQSSGCHSGNKAQLCTPFPLSLPCL